MGRPVGAQRRGLLATQGSALGSLGSGPSALRTHILFGALEQAGVEPVIIEDLIKIGEDIGEARGEARGLAEGLLRTLAGRKLSLSAAQAARVQGCADIGLLRSWYDRAFIASSGDEVFSDA
ncbi:MAG: hypothetical protein HYV07_02875 [Deltaproteobacteria bacterium]|nr:hypothetical protein [Deltaproteobacteria bacterium]